MTFDLSRKEQRLKAQENLRNMVGGGGDQRRMVQDFINLGSKTSL